MKPVILIAANGGHIPAPLFDPVVAAHWANGSSMIETLMDEVFVKEIYAPLFKGKKDLVFLDIGANIGLVSLYAYDACSRIVAVEPAPDTFEVLKAMTIALTKIERVQAALAPVDGPAEFFTNEQNTTASSTVNTYGRFSEVPGLTLTSILSIHQLEHVDVCKLDCEGGESQITERQLEGAKDIIDCYWLEVHNTPRVQWQDILAAAKLILNQIGYINQEISGMRLIARK